jgi:hypothetical protein
MTIMCPTETLVALKLEAIFGQFLSLIQDEIRGSYRTTAVIEPAKVATGSQTAEIRQNQPIGRYSIYECRRESCRFQL